MFRYRVFPVLAVVAQLCLFISLSAYLCAQITEPPEKVEPGQQMHMHEHHHLHLILGEEKCAPTYTYDEGPTGPSHWPELCTTGKMQSPIDIDRAEKLPIRYLTFKYQPSDLDIVNDCNQYRVLLKFPDNYWLTIGKRPYFLAEVHFRAPGENAIKGKRPPMSVQFVHYSPEGVFLIVEVPVVVGKENPVIKTIWEHIPESGKENKVEGVKINPMDLLPADQNYYRYPGSLTTPICTEVAQWFVMKTPIEMSEAQIAEYTTKHYHDVARPLQPQNGRPIHEPK